MAEEMFRGKTAKDLQAMSLDEFAKLAPSRIRRSLKRGFTEQQKKLMLKIQKFKLGKTKKPVKTQVRDMVILPEMIGLNIYVYNGRTYEPVFVTTEMMGHYLGEFTMTRTKVSHSAPGIGATKSSAGVQKK